MKASIPSILLFASGVIADGRFCSWPLVRNIQSVTPVWTAPQLVSGVFVGPSSTTGSISAGYSYTQSWTITGGVSGSAGILGIANLGVTTSYGQTTAKGTSLTVGITCPANVRCGLTASTYVLEVVGTETMYRCGSKNLYDQSYPCQDSAPDHCPTMFWNTTSGVTKPFTAYLPLAKSKSNVDELLSVEYNACSAGMDYAGMPRCPGY
ncbi:hypothetical protein MCOR25_000764 [Pyricularia grisea]|uniref:Uncharacterized protein n=1 Tax=Pyricularia grisea TaxID=148305 RepID=A0A6P8B9L4_PYRGI|nr:uncharacterized protein PgNI_02765 [Pyricularia grisea]KAI6382173.1 hypothetical protein MCOR25_000764 [Pyricularia grisea]TLD12491.1 hypothetical protein PgNI_02765 [Pyricularia grisea]